MTIHPLPPAARPTPVRRWVIGALVVVALIVGGVLAAYRLTQKQVTIDLDGDVRDFRTHASSVEEMLDEAQVALGPDDRVTPPLEAALTDGMTIQVRRAVSVALEVNGDRQQVHTLATDPLVVLTEQAIALGPHDVLRIDGEPFPVGALDSRAWEAPPATIQVLRSAAVTVIDGADTYDLHTTALDVSRVLAAAGLPPLYLADRITPPLDTPVSDGLTITIERSVPLTLVADGRRVATRAVGATVDDALAALGVALIGQDTVVPDGASPLEPGMTIQVVRVTEEISIEVEDIPYTTAYRADPALSPGAEHVSQEGSLGQRELTIRIRYEDGQEVARDVIGSRTIQLPVTHVIAVGPRPPAP